VSPPGSYDYDLLTDGYLSDMPDRPTRVVLANDDPIVIEGLRAMLTPYEQRVVVTGVAVGDPEIEMAPITDGEADVLMIDAFSRAAGGIDAAVKILAQQPPFAVAVFTDAGDTRLMLQALRVGVRGYILKSTSAAELVDALVRIRSGEVVIDPRLATDAALLAARSIDLGEWPGAHLGLTRREAELLVLLGEGLSPREAAHRMNLSPETVRTHTRNLYRKLDVNDRAAAVAIAWREGLVH
jgi:DNA-binding NarL/FixJ family response regulator